MPHITPRELEVVQHLALGLIPKQIAHEMRISHKTLDIHLSNLRRKLEVHTQSAILVRMFQLGYVVINGQKPVVINLDSLLDIGMRAGMSAISDQLQGASLASEHA